MAIYDYNTLGLKNMLVVDDVTTFGKGVADNFQKKFEELGGKVSRVGAGKDTTDFNSIITNAKTSNPDGVYYGGVVTSGGGLLLKQLRQQGLNIPFTGPDGIVNGAGDAKGSLIQIAGADAAADELVRHASPRSATSPAKADFEAAFADHFKADADFKTPARTAVRRYACATVILDSLKATSTRTRALTRRPSARASAPMPPIRPTSSKPSSGRSRSTRTATRPSRSSRSTRPIPPPRAALAIGSSWSSRTSLPSRQTFDKAGALTALRPCHIEAARGKDKGRHGHRPRFRKRSPRSSTRSSDCGSGRICSSSRSRSSIYFVIGPAQFFNAPDDRRHLRPRSPSATRWSTASSSSSTSPTATSSWSARSCRCSCSTNVLGSRRADRRPGCSWRSSSSSTSPSRCRCMGLLGVGHRAVRLSAAAERAPARAADHRHRRVVHPAEHHPDHVRPVAGQHAPAHPADGARRHPRRSSIGVVNIFIDRRRRRR